jgi:hypothetical protein
LQAKKLFSHTFFHFAIDLYQEIADSCNFLNKKCDIIR